MFDRIIKISFLFVGGLSGYTVSKLYIVPAYDSITSMYEVLAYLITALIFALFFYFSSIQIINILNELLLKLEASLKKATFYELMLGTIGLVLGLIVANLVTIPINKMAFVGVPISFSINLMLGYIGLYIALGKRHESIRDVFSLKGKEPARPKLLDTSVIIDGRILDIIRAGFIDGEIIIPGFVLKELRIMADSQDSLKRNKARRGLDILNIIQREIKHPVKTDNIIMAPQEGVDNQLLKTAKKYNYDVLTIDYNLNKVASVYGVRVLNINELANAVKAVALPGDEMPLRILKDGKEQGQGVGYLEDGTMIVVEEGKRYIGQTIDIYVTSILQTPAGRMIFAKPKAASERVILYGKYKKQQ